MTASRKRYLTAYAATAVLALGLYGCGGGGGDGPVTDGMDMMRGDGGTTSEPVALMAGVEGLFASNRTVGLMDDGMTIVLEDASQTPSGWSLTVNGKMVELDANDHGADFDFPDEYFKELGNDEVVYFWSEEVGGFEGDPEPEFDYVNIYGFEHSFLPDVDLSTSESVDYTRVKFIHIVHGTPSSDMPVSGTATYNGRVKAVEVPSDDADIYGSLTDYVGDFDMAASFTATGASVTGSFSFPDIPDGIIPFTVDVTDNQLSVSGLSITEGPFAGYQNIGVRGAFFGPAAAEVGGVFEGENPTASTLIHGYFAAEQTQDDQ